MKNNLIISIDGPSASGKSTVAKGVATKLKMFYVDSGSLYRAVTWNVLENNIELDREEEILGLINSTKWNFLPFKNTITFTVNGYQPLKELRSRDVTESVAIIASHICIREFIVNTLRSFSRFGSLVIEGRDIGSAVFPSTPFKFYLDADSNERAKRRHNELKDSGENNQSKEVLKSIIRRDEIDSNRSKDPLKVPHGAYCIDTTKLKINEVICIIVDKLNEQLKK